MTELKDVSYVVKDPSKTNELKKHIVDLMFKVLPSPVQTRKVT